MLVVAVVLAAVVGVHAAAGTQRSVVGDPGMALQPQVMLEGWNFCNRAGPRDLTTYSPRWADCLMPHGENAITPSMNTLTAPEPIPGFPANVTGNVDAYVQAKERFLGRQCAKAHPAWSFWTVMVKSGNIDHSAGLCAKTGAAARTPATWNMEEDGIARESTRSGMNQPHVAHTWSDTETGEGGFSGSYDAPGTVDASSWSVEWRRRASDGRWVYKHKLHTNAKYPWLMIYHRSDSVKGGSGGYPWPGAGVLLEHLYEPNFVLQVRLNVSVASVASQFYLPEFGGCWKLDGRPCDGDLATDVTRYINYIIDPRVGGSCAADHQESCPPWHKTLNGTLIPRTDTKNFPYQCYHLWCAPPNNPNYPNHCDPYSNPSPQELLQLRPCSEWAAHGFPTAGQGWLGDARLWTLRAGDLAQRLFMSGVNPAPRYWISLEVGPEMNNPNGTIHFEVSDWDVLVPQQKLN